MSGRLMLARRIVGDAHAEALDAALELIDAPEDPDQQRGMLRALINLNALLPAVRRLADGPPFDTTKDEGRLDAIHQAVADLTSRSDVEELVPTPWINGGPARTYPMHGTLETNPLFAAIWRIDPGPPRNVGVDLLAAALLTARLRHMKSPGKLVSSAAVNAGRAFRRLLGEDAGKRSLLPMSSHDLGAYLEQLGTQFKGDEALDPILYYIAVAADEKKARPASGGIGGERSTGDINGLIAPPVAGEPFTPWHRPELDGAGGIIICPTPVAQSISRELHEAGALPREVVSETEAVGAELNDGAPEHQLSRRQRAVRARQKVKGVERANQGLAGRLSALTDREAKSLATTLRSRTDESGTWSEAEQCLAACLLLGRPLDEVANLSLADTRNGSALPEGFIGLAVASKRSWWLLRPGLVARDLGSSLHRTAARATSDRLLLPCPEWFASRIGVPSTYGALASDPASLEQDVLTLLQELERAIADCDDGPARLSVARARQWLSTALERDIGHPSVTAIITGEVTSQAHAPLHYQRWTSYEIEWHYFEAIRRLEPAVTPPLPSNEPRPIPAGDYGSIFCPEDLKLVAAIERLKTHVTELRSHSDSRAGRAAFHNAYLAYTVALLSFATCMRAVNDSIPGARTIDPQLGFAVIRDKDAPDGYNARLVPMPDVALSQLGHWRVHLEAISGRLTYTDCASASRIRDWLSGGAPTRPFLINEDGLCREATVSDVNTQLAQAGWTFVANAGRHYVATKLKNKLDGDALSALMGHWVRGTEPSGRASAFDALPFRRRVLEYLSPLLADVGWEPLAGLVHD